MPPEAKVEEKKPDQVATIDIPAEKPAPQEKKYTPDQLKEQGFSQAEIEMAKNRGMIAEEKKADPAPKSEPEQKAETPAPETPAPKAEEPKPTPEDQQRVLKNDAEDKAILAEIAKAGELSPEQESAVLGLLTRNGQALYWNYKRERAKRRQVEMASEHEQIKRKALEQENEALRRENEALKGAKPKGEASGDLLALEDEKPEGDVLDRPLTLRELQEYEKRKAEQAEKTRQEREGQSRELSQKLEVMEADGKARYSDFDAAMSLANDLVKNVDALVTDPRQNAIIKRKVIEFGRAVATGDEFSPDLAYELGKLHPKYGQKPSAANGSGERENGTSNADKVARALENAGRRTSSATLTGGGRRAVSVNDITLEQAARLPASEFAKLPRDVRERLLRQ